MAAERAIVRRLAAAKLVLAAHLLAHARRARLVVMGAGVYRSGVKSVLYISPPFKSEFISKFPPFHPPNCLRAAPLRGAETDMFPPVQGAKHLWPGVKKCPPKSI